MKFIAGVFAVATANLKTVEDGWRLNMANSTLKKTFCDSSLWRIGGGRAKRPTVCNGMKDEEKKYENFVQNGYRSGEYDAQLMLLGLAENYGCWCDLGDNLRRPSHGQPANALDHACMDLHHGYNCISIDYPECDPRILDSALNEYILPLSVLSPQVDVNTVCEQYNQGNICGELTCKVEGQFLSDTYSPVYQEDQDWWNMWHETSLLHLENGGRFDFEANCMEPVVIGGASNGGSSVDQIGGASKGVSNGFAPVSQLSSSSVKTPFGTGEKLCCGVYPLRNSYFTDRAQCCNDLISPIGTC